MTNQDTRTLAAGWEAVNRIARVIASVDQALRDDPGKRDLLLAAQSMHQCRTLLAEEERYTRQWALTSTDPGVIVLLYRQRVVGRLLTIVADNNADALRAGHELLVGGDPGEYHGPRLRHGIRVIAGGAPGLGRRS